MATVKELQEFLASNLLLPTCDNSSCILQMYSQGNGLGLLDNSQKHAYNNPKCVMADGKNKTKDECFLIIPEDTLCEASCFGAALLQPELGP